MKDVRLIEELEEAAALLQPLRLRVLALLSERRSCAELAIALRETPQKVHYHVKVLERARLVEKVAERRVRALSEGLYRASARSYWLSPRLVERVGGPRRARDAASLEHLLGLAEGLQFELGALGERLVEGDAVPSLGLSADIVLADPARRAAFLRDVESAVRVIAERYGDRAAAPAVPSEPSGPATQESYRLMLACYPRPSAEAAARAPDTPERSSG